jgi:hypothetical protein
MADVPLSEPWMKPGCTSPEARCSASSSATLASRARAPVRAQASSTPMVEKCEEPCVTSASAKLSM